MDSRHQRPVLSYSARLDWSNHVVVAFVGFMGSIVAAIVLILI
jgi:hypothetical protein